MSRADWSREISDVPERVRRHWRAKRALRPPMRCPGAPETSRVEELELATLRWAHWHNQERLHGYISHVPTAEFEEEFYAEKRQEDVLAENTTLGSL